MNFAKFLYSLLLSSKIKYFSSSRQSILIIVPRLPEFDRASGDLRLSRIVEILCEKYNIFLYNDGKWEKFLQRGNFKYLRYLRQTGIDVILSEQKLKRILQNYKLKAVVVEFHDLGTKYLSCVKQHQPSVPFIIDTVDVHFLRERLMAESFGEKTLREQAEATCAKELDIYSCADFVWTVSDADRTALMKEGLPEKKIYTVPNIHEVVRECPPLSARKDKTLLFIGGFYHQPNVDAILYFNEHIFPLIRERLSGVQLKIVGANPPASIQRLDGQGVTVTGFVQNTKPYLDSAAVAIAPLRFGSGMKGKVGEALAAGLPLVTSSIGAQGMSLVSGRDCLIADRPAEFASDVVRLLSDSELWRKLSKNGRKFMQDNFELAEIRKLLLSFFDNINGNPV